MYLGGVDTCTFRVHVASYRPGNPRLRYRFRGRLRERISLILPTFWCLELINTIPCGFLAPGTVNVSYYMYVRHHSLKPLRRTLILDSLGATLDVCIAQKSTHEIKSVLV